VGCITITPFFRGKETTNFLLSCYSSSPRVSRKASFSLNKKKLNVFYQEVGNTITLYSNSCLQTGTSMCIVLAEIGLIAGFCNKIFSYPSENSAASFSLAGSIAYSSQNIKLPGCVCPQETVSRNGVLRFSFESCLYFFLLKVMWAF